MKLIEDRDVIQILRNMLNLIDERLVDHGERVTFLCVKIMEALHYRQEDIFLGAKLSLFHDIGAYKTDEVDRMLSFESNDVWEHAVYGYLFLSRMSPLTEHADCILWHHMSYEKLKKIGCSRIDITSLIHLCDRIDIYMRSDKVPDADFFAQLDPGMFFPKHVETFLKLNEHHVLSDALINGAYHKDMDILFESYTFSEEEKHMYLCMLAYSIDFNSEYTVSHTIITTSLAQEIARFCHVDHVELDKIYYGALLHDVGKAAIPISILEKPGKLTNEEMKIMRTHVIYSEKVLKGYLPEDILRIAVRHHEKLDGSGYPNGLHKEDLTLSECIVAVADILSALLGRRSYKQPLSIERTIEIVQGMAEEGKLSKTVVDAFVQNYHKILSNTYQSSKQLNDIYQAMQKDYLITCEKIKKYL